MNLFFSSDLIQLLFVYHHNKLSVEKLAFTLQCIRNMIDNPNTYKKVGKNFHCERPMYFAFSKGEGARDNHFDFYFYTKDSWK